MENKIGIKKCVVCGDYFKPSSDDNICCAKCIKDLNDKYFTVNRNDKNTTEQTATTDRKKCLETAINCVCGERDQEYGSPLENFKNIADFWTKYKQVEITPKDVAVMMALLKIARIMSNNPKADNWIDACGYLACGCEIEGENNK